MQFSTCGNLGTQHRNLLCAQVNSASCPQQDEKWVVAYGLPGEAWRPSVADRSVVCLLAASRRSSWSMLRAMDDCIVCCGSSWQSAATSEIVKHFWFYSCKTVRNGVQYYASVTRDIIVDRVETYFMTVIDGVFCLLTLGTVHRRKPRFRSHAWVKWDYVWAVITLCGHCSERWRGGDKVGHEI